MKADRHDKAVQAVRAMLRRTAPPAPIESVNWHALHQRIMTDAAGRGVPGLPTRQTSPWWEFAERWANVAAPIAMAAGLVAALTLARIDTGADVRVSMVAAIRGELPVSTVTDALVGPATERWFVSAAVGE